MLKTALPLIVFAFAACGPAAKSSRIDAAFRYSLSRQISATNACDFYEHASIDGTAHCTLTEGNSALRCQATGAVAYDAFDGNVNETRSTSGSADSTAVGADGEIYEGVEPSGAYDSFSVHLDLPVTADSSTEGQKAQVVPLAAGSGITPWDRAFPIHFEASRPISGTWSGCAEPAEISGDETFSVTLTQAP